MIRRFAFIVIGLGVTACANDYDQFDFDSRPSPKYDASVTDGNSGKWPPRPDASWGDARERDGSLDDSDEVSDGADSGSSEEPPDAQEGEAGPDAGIDVDGGADALDGGPFDDAMADAAADAGTDDADDGATTDDALPDTSVGDDGGVDASTPPDAPSDDSDGSDDASVGEGGPATDGDVDSGCGPDNKLCGNDCVTLDDPTTGCAGSSCEPCDLPHAAARCGDGGLCTIGVCAAGFEDCDRRPANGCEASIANDVDHCGACGRGCSDAHVLSRERAAGVCVSTCELGFANCDWPATGTDNGCERAVSGEAANCGSCGNDCRAQGAGLVCGITPNRCGCSDNAACRTDGSTGSCETETGLCKCGPSLCRPGEACGAAPGPDGCSCNGGAACSGAETCCETPAGCRDLESDPSNCGACGRTCPRGLFCAAGLCACNANSQCDAGAVGACRTGRCVCNGTVCPQGQRCVAGGRCG